MELIIFNSFLFVQLFVCVFVVFVDSQNTPRNDITRSRNGPRIRFHNEFDIFYFLEDQYFLGHSILAARAKDSLFPLPSCNLM